jgi:hypothetical protein
MIFDCDSGEKGATREEVSSTAAQPLELGWQSRKTLEAAEFRESPCSAAVSRVPDSSSPVPVSSPLVCVALLPASDPDHPEFFVFAGGRGGTVPL